MVESEHKEVHNMYDLGYGDAVAGLVAQFPEDEDYMEGYREGYHDLAAAGMLEEV
jgi:hypothetical protein